MLQFIANFSFSISIIFQSIYQDFYSISQHIFVKFSLISTIQS